MSAHTGRLLLSTQDPHLLPNPTSLMASLTEAGFIGSPLAGMKGAFAVGENFLQQVTFAGCSVRLELEPKGNSPFCHIRFLGPFGQPIFLSGRNTRPPRCPNCRSPLQVWKDALQKWNDAGSAQISCPACGRASPPWAYDWRGKAGFGRLFILIEEVFPGEGAPTPGLLNLIECSTGCRWHYFYIQDA